MLVIRASTEHNELPPDDGLKKIKNQFEGTKREEQGLHGGFAAAEGRVFPEFSRNTYVVPEGDVVDLVSDDDPIYGYDAGWKDPRVIVQYERTHYGQWIAVDSFHRSSSTIEDAIRWLDARDKPEGPIYCEHEPSVIDTSGVLNTERVSINADPISPSYYVRILRPVGLRT